MNSRHHSEKPITLHSLHDLREVQRVLQQRAEQAAAIAKAQAEADRREAAQHNLFQAAVGAVQPLSSHTRVALASPRPAPIPRQLQRDEEAALQDSLSDDMDVSTLLETDAQLSYRRNGVGPDVTTQLRKGKWAIQSQIDLHGLRTEAAREALARFLRDAHKQGLRCVRVVHGKGLGSPGKTPVLKAKVQRWLVQKAEVIAFVQARPLDGGSGALVVLLQTAHKSSSTGH